MPRFGAHVSIAGGVDKAVDRAAGSGCDCFQIFVKSPQQWAFPAMDDAQVERFRRRAGRLGLGPVVGHVSYLVNVASPDRALRDRSRACLLEEWDRAARLGLDGLVLHPGAHGGAGKAAGMLRAARSLDWLHERRPDRPARVLLETTSGSGSVLGGTFEELARLLDRTRHEARIGLALDTCHLFAAGYDLRTAESLDATLGRLDELLGLGRVAVVHANDSKGGLGSHRDRHEHVGRGQIGRKGFALLVRHPALAALPFVLETPKTGPKGEDMDRANLRTLRRLAR